MTMKNKLFDLAFWLFGLALLVATIYVVALFNGVI